MKKFLKFIAEAALIAAILTVIAPIGATLTPAACADGVSQYTAFSMPSPGNYTFGYGLGHVEHVRITGALPTNGTVIVNRITRDTTSTNTAATVTNALVTFTCASGGYEADIGTGTNLWFLAGDKLQRAGTVVSTNECIIILKGN